MRAQASSHKIFGATAACCRGSLKTFYADVLKTVCVISRMPYAALGGMHISAVHPLPQRTQLGLQLRYTALRASVLHDRHEIISAKKLYCGRQCGRVQSRSNHLQSRHHVSRSTARRVLINMHLRRERALCRGLRRCAGRALPALWSRRSCAVIALLSGLRRHGWGTNVHHARR